MRALLLSAVRRNARRLLAAQLRTNSHIVIPGK
jgi:hypothetical protein